MGNKIPEHVIQQIKDRVSIREVVEDYVRLQKDGANHKGLCPFHKEKTPSFKVHEGKGIFKCFGCGESGNAFGFLMKKEGMSFPEALERLAARAGVELPRREQSPEEQKREKNREKLYAANQAAAEFYHRTLLESDVGKKAAEYLHKRGITDDAISRYMLGYSPPGWEETMKALKRQGVSVSDLHGAGLVIANDRGGYYDRFRGRIMFPIMDTQGRSRGFGARLMDDDPKQPKYINSPETPIYRKGMGFYGLYQAKDEIRRNKRVLIVEGYFDQIVLHQAGIKYAAATLGTALTPEHAQTIRRLAPEVFLVFDADEAGRKASVRALEVFLEAGLSPRIVKMPEGKDPDDFLQENSPRDFERIMEESPPLLSFYMDRILSATGSTPSEVAKAVSQAIEMVERVEDPIERSMFLDQLSRKSNVALPQLEARINRPGKRKNEKGDRDQRFSGFDDLSCPPAERDLVRLLVHHPETAGKIRESGVVAKLRHQGMAEFIQSLLDQERDTGKIDPGNFLHKISDPGLLDRVSRAILENDPFSGMAERAAADAIHHVFQGWDEAKLTKLRNEISEAQEKGNEGLWRRLLEEQHSLLAKQREVVSGESG